MIHKMLSLYQHIPEETITAFQNEYDLVVEPKPKLKVITLDFIRDGSAFILSDSMLSDYDAIKNVTDYFYRGASAATVSPFLSLYVTEEGLQKDGEYSKLSKDYKKIIRILNSNTGLNPDLAGLGDMFIEDDNIIFEKLNKYLNATNKTPYLLTIRIDGLYIGRSPLFKTIRENASVEYYKDFYTLKDNRIIGTNLACSMCLTAQEELWGYVSVFNFYTSKTEFAPIAGGFKKELAHRNYPVCPDCASKLKKLHPVVNKYFRFKFCGFDYLLIPETVKTSINDDLMPLIVDIMVTLHDSEPGTPIHLKTRLGDFSLGERKRLIDSYSKDIFDCLAQTNNNASYTMLFFEESNAQFKILLSIEDVFPSQFQAIFAAKARAEDHDIFKNLPGANKGEVYDLEFRFDSLKEFLPINDRIEGNFSKVFLETTRNIFMQKSVSFSFLLQRMMGTIRRRFTNEQNFELCTRKAFIVLKFLSYLNILDTFDNNSIKEVTMTGKYAEFFVEHKDFFDSGAKQYVFLTGVLTQLLLNIQLRDKSSAPFRKRLNGLKLNKDIIGRIFTEAVEKLNQYGKNFYWDLEQDIADLAVKGGLEKLSNDEISYFFTLGMTLYKKFKTTESQEQEN